MTRRLRAVLFPALLTLAGCATRLETMSYAQRQDLLPAFQQGRIVLDCGVACAWPWISRREALYSLYAAGQWDALAAQVAEIGYQEDLAYYWLGRAAEGQGFLPAAARYYAEAAALARSDLPIVHCAGNLREGCFGIDVLRESSARLARLRPAFYAPRPVPPMFGLPRPEGPYERTPYYPPGTPTPLLPSGGGNGDDNGDGPRGPYAPALPEPAAPPSRASVPPPRPPENEIELPPIRR